MRKNKQSWIVMSNFLKLNPFPVEKAPSANCSFHACARLITGGNRWQSLSHSNHTSVTDLPGGRYALVISVCFSAAHLDILEKKKKDGLMKLIEHSPTRLRPQGAERKCQRWQFAPRRCRTIYFSVNIFWIQINSQSSNKIHIDLNVYFTL